VRNVADGKALESWDARGHGRRSVMSRRGTANPMEGAGGGDTDGGHETEDSEGERSSRGDEAVSASKRRTASGGYRQSRWKQRGHTGPGEPNDPGSRAHIKTLKSRALPNLRRFPRKPRVSTLGFEDGYHRINSQRREHDAT
jgi:hypothetical protein